MTDKANEPSEVWEHPFAEVVDRKLKPIKRDLQRLKQALDAIAAEQKTAILQTQRFLASLQIRVVHNESLGHIKKNQKDIFPQFVSELTTVLNNISKSEDPLSVANEFLKTRWDDLKELGAESIWVSY